MTRLNQPLYGGGILCFILMLTLLPFKTQRHIYLHIETSTHIKNALPARNIIDSSILQTAQMILVSDIAQIISTKADGK
jgi:hypothetical protein